MADDKFKAFNLVGGTALALKLGHRKSIDIDLFSTDSFNATALSEYITDTYNAGQLRAITNGVFGFIDGIKIDLIAHQYPLVDNIETIEGIRMVSLLDISAMKLNAIYNNGTRLKDLVDMYALLEIFPLQQMLQACQQKYPEINIGMVKNALLHHEDIDLSVPIDYTAQDIEWPAISDRLRNAFRQPELIFKKIPDSTLELMKKIRQKNKGQGKGRRPRL
jgi:hypothetical protein